MAGKDIATQTLRTRTATWLSVTIYILATLMFIALGTSIITGSITYDKEKKNFTGKNADEIGILSPVMGAVALLLLVILLVIYQVKFAPIIQTDDKFLTDLNRLNSTGVTVKDFRNSFTDYMTKRTGIQFNENETKNLGNILAGNYEQEGTLFRHQNPQQFFPQQSYNPVRQSQSVQ